MDMSLEAKKARRAALIAALRSGNYQQATGALCVVNPADKTQKYCCLGVASVLVREANYNYGERKAWSETSPFGSKISNALNLPSDIRDAYGFTDQSGGFIYSAAVVDKFPRLAEAHGSVDCGPLVVGKSRICLTSLNDALKWSFKEIADLIEYEPEGMFTD